jgi:broad specificity phosphatase PhoE
MAQARRRRSLPPAKRRVVVVRHAERADEAPLQHLGGVPWVLRRARHDPPLTRRGEEMASLAGSHIARVTAAGREDVGAALRAAAGSVAGAAGSTGAAAAFGSRRAPCGGDEAHREADAGDEEDDGEEEGAGRGGGDLGQPYQFSAVYSSPLVRCLQTAAAIARELGGLPLVANSALSACAQKVRVAGAAGRPVSYASPAELQAVATGLTLHLDGMQPHGDDDGLHGLDAFRSAVERIAREDPGAGGVLVVTHREGIRELDRLCGEGRMATPYCVVHEYDFDVGTGKWALVHTSRIRVPRGAAKRRAIVEDYRFAFQEETRAPASHSRCWMM